MFLCYQEGVNYTLNVTINVLHVVNTSAFNFRSETREMRKNNLARSSRRGGVGRA